MLLVRLVDGFGKSHECHWLEQIVNRIDREPFDGISVIGRYEYYHRGLRQASYELDAVHVGIEFNVRENEVHRIVYDMVDGCCHI